MASFLNPVDMSIAGKGVRFGNYLLDVIAFYLFMVVLGIIFYAVGISEAVLSLLENDTIGYIIGGLFYTGFMAGQEIAFKGRSIGKFLTGTQAVTENGALPTASEFIIRNLCRAIPFDPLSFLFANFGWHDSISKTRVVVKKEFDRRKQNEEGIDQIGKPEFT